MKGGARIVQATPLIPACEALEVACEGLNSALLSEAVDGLPQAMEVLEQRP
ncbi:hypothetical protein SOP86_18695 [Pseudomonas canadensis]|uniref:hypothetical protein n=1 Tax=Pseudomonas canadensis TaxID=915099 RepID=UPI002B2486E3|nr:hypothetical protein [Pseudomonas canadensis]MEB2647671.1 hypothetical protein [Pseudomonas canadensis]